MKRQHLLLVGAIIGILLIVASVWWYTQEDFSILVPIAEENFAIHEQEMIPREEITSFLVTEDRIYVYYDKSGLVNAYYLDGTYDFGIQVPTIKSGKGDIAYKDGYLFVELRRSVIDVFSKDLLVHQIAITSNRDEYMELREIFTAEKNHATETAMYSLADSKKEIILQATEQIVIDSPKTSKLAKSLMVAGLLTLGISLGIGSKRHFFRRQEHTIL